MTIDQRRRGQFEERLLSELRSFVVAQSSEESERPSPKSRALLAFQSRRRVALVGGVAAVLAIAAGAGVPFITGGAAPAYAVIPNGDGTVTVEISSLRDAAGLESKLREAGINAIVQYVPPGKACQQPWFTPASAPAGASAMQGGVGMTADGRTRFTISSNLPTDETLVIMTQTAGAAGPAEAPGPTAIGIAVAQGDVKPCQLVDAPADQPFGPPPPPGSGTLHTDGSTPSTSGTGLVKNGSGPSS